jgi:hypothetical protein
LDGRFIAVAVTDSDKVRRLSLQIERHVLELARLRTLVDGARATVLDRRIELRGVKARMLAAARALPARRR